MPSPRDDHRSTPLATTAMSGDRGRSRARIRGSAARSRAAARATSTTAKATRSSPRNETIWAIGKMPLDAEERRPGEDGCRDREQHGHEDPEQAQHVGDSMSAVWEIGHARAGRARRRRRRSAIVRATLGRAGDASLRGAERPASALGPLRRHRVARAGDGGRAPARTAHGRPDRPRHDVGLGRGGRGRGIPRHDLPPRHGAVGPARVAQRPRARVSLRSRTIRRCAR